ncbi:MAG: hypothetical protein Q9M32_08900 [Sulfurimonas sp.]|nr:hypothetical protein [Sulfurimonas sp.]
MTQAYKYSIAYFLLFTLLLLLSGALLFDDKIGFSIEGVLNYYLGNEEAFTQEKSAFGILKIILPHIFAFGLFCMVLLHFLVFTKQRNLKKTKALVYLLFISAFLEIGSPFLIINGYEFGAYIKLFSFFLFEALVLYTAYLLLFSIAYE